MKIKRFVSILLALCCVLTLIPFSVVTAYAVEPEGIAKTLHVPYQVNPLYADVLGDGEPDHFASSIPARTYGEVSYISENEVVPALREAMVNRDEIIEINFKASSSSIDLKAFFIEALAHTGNPVEGDYLRYTYAAMEASADLYNDGKVQAIYLVDYYTTAAQEKTMDQAVNKLLGDLNVTNGTDYQKVRAIYEYITNTVRYDNTNLNNPNYTLKYSAYAALVNKTAVCQGYASLFYRLALELDVDARVISGVGNGGPHGWNIVELNGKYYNLDATWDAGKVLSSFRYFLRCPNNFSDHIRNEEYTTTAFHKAYPMATTDYKVSAVKITTQPTNVTVASGAKAKVTIAATGEGLTYQWYYKDKGSSKFYLTTSFTSNSYSVTMSGSRAGRQVYCVVTDKYGNFVTSNTVTLNMK